MRTLGIMVMAAILMSTFGLAHASDDDLTTNFINKMVAEHGFDRDKLNRTFAQVKVQESILKAIARPAEKSKAWYEYRKIFITKTRIDKGVEFWQQNKQALMRAEKQYGVPAEIVVAIIGVETRYGGNMGSFRVIDALSTLAFHYPKRSKYFTKELENFLILTRQEKIDPLAPKGSYAGAMGLGQFMPSSFLHYAVDFDGDNHRNIWTDPDDAVGSVANYFAEHGWIKGATIARFTLASKPLSSEMKSNALKPSYTRAQLKQAGLDVGVMPVDSGLLSVITLTQSDNEDYWIGANNFYVITRYNHSYMYAMAVLQLAQAIRDKISK